MDEIIGKMDGLDDENNLASIIYEQLKNKDYHSARNEIRRKKYRKYLTNNSMEIVPRITRNLKEDFCSSDTERCVENLLTYIAGFANYKEVTLVLLEEAEMFKSEKIFWVMLKPLQKVLLSKVGCHTKLGTFSLVFKTIYSHIAVLPLPENYNFEDDERKLLDCDLDNQTLTSHMQNILTFYLEIFDKVMTNDLIWVNANSSNEYLSFVLLKYFDRPLTYLDIYRKEKGSESAIFRTVEKFVFMIRTLLSNPYKLFNYIEPGTLNPDSSDKIERNEDSDLEMEEKEDLTLSVSTFFYCIFSQDMENENVPFVYSPEYIYLKCIPCYLILLNMKEFLSIHKGLLLFQSLLSRLTSKLGADTLEYNYHYKITDSLINIMTLCDCRELRKMSLSCFKLFLNNFDSHGKYILTSKMLRTAKHSGVRGVIIHYIKQIIVDILNGTMDRCPLFNGYSLQKLLLLVCFLPQGEMTDLLENSDAIMEALNFILYLTLKDKDDTLKIWPIFNRISDEFMKPVMKGLQLSRAHYKLKLEEIQSSKKSKKSMELEMNISIGSEPLPELTCDEELKVINHALNYFDVIQSVWARVDKSISCIGS